MDDDFIKVLDDYAEGKIDPENARTSFTTIGLRQAQIDYALKRIEKLFILMFSEIIEEIRAGLGDKNQ